MFLEVALCLGLSGYFASCQEFVCPDKFEGYYPHDISCDQYWECSDGVATLQLCGNGLAFDDLDPTYTTRNCDYSYNVECGNRSQLEAPIPSSSHCPRVFGVFPDEDDCTAFYQCRDYTFNRFSCAPGLAFDIESRVCKWADQVTRCHDDEARSVEGESQENDLFPTFECPSLGKESSGKFSKHPHREDCRKYYVCINGMPRVYGCPMGTVFQVGASFFDGKCANPSEVPECKNYYGDLTFDTQALVKAGVDPEAVGIEVQDNSVSSQRVPSSPVAVDEPRKEEILPRKTHLSRTASPSPAQDGHGFNKIPVDVPKNKVKSVRPAPFINRGESRTQLPLSPLSNFNKLHVLPNSSQQPTSSNNNNFNKVTEEKLPIQQQIPSSSFRKESPRLSSNRQRIPARFSNNARTPLVTTPTPTRTNLPVVTVQAPTPPPPSPKHPRISFSGGVVGGGKKQPFVNLQSSRLPPFVAPFNSKLIGSPLSPLSVGGARPIPARTTPFVVPFTSTPQPSRRPTFVQPTAVSSTLLSRFRPSITPQSSVSVTHAAPTAVSQVAQARNVNVAADGLNETANRKPDKVVTGDEYYYYYYYDDDDDDENSLVTN